MTTPLEAPASPHLSGSSAGRPPAWRIWWSAARPRTLTAALAPVLVGTGYAWRADAVGWAAAGWCLAFALLIQIATNFANDYYDARRGADDERRLGPPRAVASGWVSPGAMRAAMIVTFVAAFAAGLPLLAYGGWPLLLIGLASIACGVAYTGGPYPLAYHGWGDVFVFVFFGLVAVGATTFVQTGVVPWSTGIGGASIGALAVNLLLINNYRDMEGDARVGKRTLVVRLGRPYAGTQFAFAHGVATCAPLFSVWAGQTHPVAAGVLTFLSAFIGIRQGAHLAAARSPEEFGRLLSQAGRWLGLYALIFAVGLILA